jgi:hypothetical protein
VRGIRRSFAQGLEQIGVEVGYARIPVIKHCHAVGENTVSLGNGTVDLGRGTTVVGARDFAERGRRGRCRLMGEGSDDRSGDHDQADGERPESLVGPCSC